MDKNSPANAATEQIVGYDARDLRNDFDSLWPPQRREQFLYRLDVKKVLSVDLRVWPSVFTAAGTPAPPHQTAMQDLCADRVCLQDPLTKAPALSPFPPFCTIGVALVDDGAVMMWPMLGS
jgi:hypothetical protein